MQKIILAGGIIAALLLGGFFFFQGHSSDDRQKGVSVDQEDASGVQRVPLEEEGDAFFSRELGQLDQHTVTFENGTSAPLWVADGFELTLAAEGLGKARFMTRSPDGRVFVPDMVDYNLSHEGKLYILDDFNTKTGQFESKTTYLSGLRGPNNVAFYTDEAGNDWLYLTLTEHLVRYPYHAGDTEPSGEPEVVLEFPNEQSEGADGVIWHITRTVMFVDDTMYVSVGSGCNVCEEAEDEIRAMIITADPDGNNVEVYAEGIKNAVGMEWVDGELYATENGSDHLGDDIPDDTLYRVTEGAHYGWPYCYEHEGVISADTTQEWDREPISCESVPRAFSAFDAHAAPLGVTYFDKEAHPRLADAFLVALQGSWDVEVGTGYQVVRILRDGTQDVFIDGFLTDAYERVGRPVHVLQWSADSFLVTDDFNGKLYYVSASSS